MGKKGGSAAPPPPDPYAVAAAQGAANVETAQEQARLNRVNEFTPFGSVTYVNNSDPTVPYSRTTSLHPEEQKLLDSQRAQELSLSKLGTTILNRVAPDLATPFTLNGLPQAPVANDATRLRVEQALLDRLEPYMKRDEDALRTRLANTGFDQGSEGYARAIDEQTRARNDARLAAVAQGGAEQSRLFGLEQTARQQAIQEAALARSQPLNEIAAILGTGQVQAPNFGGVPQVGVAAPDLQGAVYNSYNAQLNAANQASQRRSSGMGSLFGLAGTALGAYFGGPLGASVGGSIGSKIGGG